MFVFKKKNFKNTEKQINVVLAGNPNVGKSTVFNALTGAKQHTGNWPGKTVDTAVGSFLHNGIKVNIADIPGTYSLNFHSEEEKCASNYIIYGKSDIAVIVSDATSLEQSIILALQIAETEIKPILCINFLKQANKKGISIDVSALEELLGFPVVEIDARTKQGLNLLKDLIVSDFETRPFFIAYPDNVEKALHIIKKVTEKFFSKEKLPVRYSNLRLLEGRKTKKTPQIYLDISKAVCYDNNIDPINDISAVLVKTAQQICEKVTVKSDENTNVSLADKIVTGRYTAFPVMFLLLAVIFYITLKLSAYPSDFLSKIFGLLETKILDFCNFIKCPEIIYRPLVFGVYRVTAFVTAVMFPPMAIFFPFFTLLEDLGFLPRIAFNLDNAFSKCNSCGKQSLTMCMGFGCNAVGVTGCRIIDSERERLIAILTNTLIPCNGRFPALITLISVFLTYNCKQKNLISALVLSFIILFSILLTLLVSKFLSVTLLKGKASSFTLELPPYRKPQVLSILIRSLIDRTVFILIRAVKVAAPAGLILYFICNLKIGNAYIFSYICKILNPLGILMGVDGAVILSFILGMPANEIVLPILFMLYSGGGVILTSIDSEALRQLFVLNGWTFLTALNTVLIFLMHFPCSTTLITIKKETGSKKMTLTAFLLPVILGILCCLTTTLIFKIVNYFA